MDSAAAEWAHNDRAPLTEASRVARWVCIRYRALRVRRLTRRAKGGDWLDGVSLWAFWGLHR